MSRRVCESLCINSASRCFSPGCGVKRRMSLNIKRHRFTETHHKFTSFTISTLTGSQSSAGKDR